MRCSGSSAPRSTAACRMSRCARPRPRRRSGRRAASSTSSRRCSASIHSPAGSRCSRCWRCGCSSASISRSRPRACSSSGRARSRAFSYPVAAWLSQRIGLVNTMVFTHIPSSIFLILAAFAPNLIVALALLLARSALSQMDVPTRTSYVMAVVTPAERTAAASVTAVPRSLAVVDQPGADRRAARDAGRRAAVHRLRRAQDRLRPGAALLVPPREAAGGAGIAFAHSPHGPAPRRLAKFAPTATQETLRRNPMNRRSLLALAALGAATALALSPPSRKAVISLAAAQRALHPAARAGLGRRYRRAADRRQAVAEMGQAGRDREQAGRRRDRGDHGVHRRERRSYAS